MQHRPQNAECKCQKRFSKCFLMTRRLPFELDIFNREEIKLILPICICEGYAQRRSGALEWLKPHTGSAIGLAGLMRLCQITHTRRKSAFPPQMAPSIKFKSFCSFFGPNPTSRKLPQMQSELFIWSRRSPIPKISNFPKLGANYHCPRCVPCHFSRVVALEVCVSKIYRRIPLKDSSC